MCTSPRTSYSSSEQSSWFCRTKTTQNNSMLSMLKCTSASFQIHRQQQGSPQASLGTFVRFDSSCFWCAVIWLSSLIAPEAFGNRPRKLVAPATGFNLLRKVKQLEVSVSCKLLDTETSSCFTFPQQADDQPFPKLPKMRRNTSLVRQYGVHLSPQYWAD